MDRSLDQKIRSRLEATIRQLEQENMLLRTENQNLKAAAASALNFTITAEASAAAAITNLKFILNDDNSMVNRTLGPDASHARRSYHTAVNNYQAAAAAAAVVVNDDLLLEERQQPNTSHHPRQRLTSSVSEGTVVQGGGRVGLEGATTSATTFMSVPFGRGRRLY